MPKGHQRSRSNFRGEGHPPWRSRVYFAEDNSELKEMFDQCTVQDLWSVSTHNSEATNDWEVTFDMATRNQLWTLTAVHISTYYPTHVQRNFRQLFQSAIVTLLSMV